MDFPFLMLYHVHANVFAAPSGASAGSEVSLRGLPLPTLAGASGGPPVFDAAFAHSFEEIQASLLKLPRSDCEPDGFFLITGGAGGAFWRLNGHMHEHQGRMHRIELNGECPEEAFDAVLTAFGWPSTALVFELVQEGVTLDEKAFRQWAAALES